MPLSLTLALRQQTTDRKQTVGRRKQTADRKQQASDSRQQKKAKNSQIAEAVMRLRRGFDKAVMLSLSPSLSLYWQDWLFASTVSFQDLFYLICIHCMLLTDKYKTK